MKLFAGILYYDMSERSTGECKRNCKRLERLIRQEEKSQKELLIQVMGYEKRLSEISKWFCGSSPREIHRLVNLVEEEVTQNQRIKKAFEKEYSNSNVMKKLEVRTIQKPSLLEQERREEVERVIRKLYKTESLLLKRIEKIK